LRPIKLSNEQRRWTLDLPHQHIDAHSQTPDQETPLPPPYHTPVLAHPWSAALAPSPIWRPRLRISRWAAGGAHPTRLPDADLLPCLGCAPWERGGSGLGSVARQTVLQMELERILSILRDRYAPQAVYVFGSAAAGLVEEDSDLDVLIVKQTEARWLDRIKEVLLLTRPRTAVDFMVLTPDEWLHAREEDPFFREEVYQKGRRVYGTG